MKTLLREEVSQTSAFTDYLLNWLSSSLRARDVLLRQHHERITNLEKGMKQMADDLSKLEAEVTRLDSNEQKEEAEITALKTKQADLEAQLAAATAGGDQEGIDAATAKLAAINQRIEALVTSAVTTPVSSAGTASE